MNIQEYIKKLQALPEPKKKIIFGFFVTKNNIGKIGESVKNINLPKFDMPQDSGISLPDIDLSNVSEGGAGIVQDQTADWKTYTNKKYGFEIKYPEGWILDKSRITDLDLHLSKKVEKEETIIDVEVVSQTRGIKSAEKAFDSVVAKMQNVTSPKEQVVVGKDMGYEAIGTLCTAVCIGSSEDRYSLFSIIYFSHGNEVFYVDYVEGVEGEGFKNNIKNWKNYSEFKDILATFHFNEAAP